ncbi:conserved hypothetical protein [Histoplasma capsulatum var. duboisii H88]|uniref:Uncharacterized protein n=1 Tax=Ajellomyces capsulatus (strain H88) TaxID=544711 RepID=F0UIW3_AJEC8|nr:conserved hypothetical protein [Histoplasma capsulatum var. duboisii H88]
MNTHAIEIVGVLDWHRLYRALQQHGTARPDYIWISDELVYEDFFRFTRIHKRCSSSVPGPLEAQKRLSKRRHTALALMRSRPPSMEAAILFGKPELQNSDVHPVGVHPWSPQALEAFPYLHNDVPPVPQAWKDDNTRNSQFDTILDNTAPPSSPSYAFLRMHLSSSAWKSSSLNEFKKYIAVSGLDPQGRSLISRIALSEILLVQNRSGRSKRWNIDDLHGFFSDPFLNVPAAENYVTLVEHCTMHTERKSRLYAHFRFLKRSIMLGLVPVEEIAKIIKLIPLIKTKTREHGKSTIGKANWADVATCYQAIWDGLKASSVLKPSDLGRETMTLWVEEILKVSPHGRLSQLGMDVIHALDGSGAAGLNLADVLLRRIVLTAASVPESTNIDIPDDALHGTLLYARSLLNSCPPEVAVAHILKTTELLVFSPVYTKWGSQSLRIWYWVLSRLDNDLVLLSATSRSNFDSASSLTSSTTWDTNGLDIPNRLRNLLKLWVLAVLGHTTDSYAILDSRRRNVFRRLLSSLDRASGPFRAQKQFRWNRESGHAGGPDCLDPVIKATLLNPTHSPKTIKEILPYFSMYTRNRAAIYATFDQLAKSTDVTSSSFIHQIITFTEAGAIPRSAILRLLRRHTPLKVALSRCWQEPAPTHAITEPRAPPPDPSLYPNPNECLRMLHILALVFACTTTVTPTTSWRLTQWVYLFIVQHHGPVSPILARALFQAGVTRYREAGKPVPKRKYAFIMQKIREAEGAAVANALLDAEMF